MVQVTQPFVHHCLPIRDRNGHKGTFGKVHILAGSVGFTGAPGQNVHLSEGSLVTIPVSDG